MDLEMIAQMKVEELRNFLRLRGLRVKGKKDELVARVFVASENEVPLVKTAEEVQAEIMEEYGSKLFVEGEHLPDPMTISNGWLQEKDSVKFWPTTLYPDIFNFLSFHPSELKGKDLSDYKTSKAYSYYATGWLNPLLFHAISEESKFCFLKTTCKPSQRITDVPHKLWVCLCKRNGKIFKAHCTCMAGFSQTCNHVAAALFRIEAAVRMGITNPSCTTTACEWLPKNKIVKQVKLKDLKLSRSDFGRRGRKLSELNCSPKKKFDVTQKFGKELSLAEVASALQTVCNETESIIFTAQAKEHFSDNSMETDQIKVQTLSDFLSTCTTKDEFCYKIEYFKGHLSEIELETRGQSTNPLWYEVRRHMVTASKAHDVKTRMVTFYNGQANGKGVDLTSIREKISGQKAVNPLLPSLRYGQAMEGEAVETFAEIFKESHKNVSVEECGIFLCPEIPFVGGSPDRIISCDCCGKSCLEVKCPISINHLSPMDSEAKLPYLKKVPNKPTVLNRNHKYYTQCQVQMAASNIKSSYFFVWTTHGYFLEKVDFDNEFWDMIKEHFLSFYMEHYLPNIFS